MTKQYIFLFFLCLSILLLGFSTQYYMNNKSFDKFVKDNEFNLTIYSTKYTIEEYKTQSENNLKYNPLLLFIIKSSVVGICIFGYLTFINRKNLNTNYTNEMHEVQG